ncbi:MAG: DUF2034 domain-containing protein [Methylobacter sp.]
MLKNFVAKGNIDIYLRNSNFHNMSVREKRDFKKNNPNYESIEQADLRLYKDLYKALYKSEEPWFFNIPFPFAYGESIYKKEISQLINELKRQKRYTDALLRIIQYLVKLEFKVNYRIVPSIGALIGELLIDMGAIDSALKLYVIDEAYFNAPNIISLLANSAIRVGNLEWTMKLVEKLINQEPYHPSIPVLQAEIRRLEQRCRLKSSFSIDFSKLDELSGLEFEYLISNKFSVLGFKVESTPRTGDFGADLIVENKEGTRIIVQCKRFKSKVNLKAVQEVIGAMGHYVGDIGIVITNNSFLNSAIKLAESHDIELWDCDKLLSFLAGDLSFSEKMA